SDWDGRREKDAITPDDWRTGSAARHFDFPANVLRLAPLDRRIRRFRDTGRIRTAPLSPVFLGVVQREGVRGGGEGDCTQHRAPTSGFWALARQALPRTYPPIP